MNTEQKKRVLFVLLRFTQGFLVGAGAILPGISGGALCLSFGYYLPMMEVISNPKAGLKKHYALFIPFGLGWLAAFFICAIAMGLLFKAYESEATILFAGLIVGSFPALYKESGRDGRGKMCFIGFCIAFAAVAALLTVVISLDLRVTPSPLWNCFIGFMWGISLIFPGMNSTPLITSLGLYGQWSAGVGSFDLAVMLPWLATLALTAFVLSRTVTALIKTHFGVVAHVMLGVVVSSTAAMLADLFIGGGLTADNTFVSLLLLAAGIAISLVMSRFASGNTAK